VQLLHQYIHRLEMVNKNIIDNVLYVRKTLYLMYCMLLVVLVNKNTINNVLYVTKTLYIMYFMSSANNPNRQNNQPAVSGCYRSQNNQLAVNGCYRQENNQLAVNSCYYRQHPRPEKPASGKQSTLVARERERERAERECARARERDR
jgi:hypothetical protein